MAEPSKGSQAKQRTKGQRPHERLPRQRPFANKLPSTGIATKKPGFVLPGPAARRRDFRLIRTLLLRLERDGPQVPTLSDYSNAQVHDHLVMLIDAGYLAGSVLREGNGSIFALVERITWSGHDLIALFRNDEKWQSATTALLDADGRASTDVLLKGLKDSA